MRHDDPSNSKDQQVDSISVDFVSILTKLVEDNDNLQKRIDDLEKSNLAKRVDTLEKSLKQLRTTQSENGSLRKSMTKLISILQDPELQKKITEPKKECHKSNNESTTSNPRSEHHRSGSHVPSEHRNGDERSHHASRSCKRFKFNDGRSSYDRQRRDSSQRSSIEKRGYSGTKYSEETHRSAGRSNFDSRISHVENTERSYHERHNKSNSRRSNTDDRSSAGSIQRTYEHKEGFHINSRIAHDEIPRIHEPKYPGENHHSLERPNSSHRHSLEENTERSSHERHGRTNSQRDTTEERRHHGSLPKKCESKDGCPANLRFTHRENAERSSHERHCRNKSQRSNTDEKGHSSSNQKNHDLVHNETKKLDGCKYSEEDHRSAEQSNSDHRLSNNEILKISQTSSSLSLWKSTCEIDLRKVHSTPMKFLTTLPNFLNYKLVSPLPSTPDQLKEKFKEHDNVKVSPMSSLTNESQESDGAKEDCRSKEEIKDVVIEPRKEDCVAIQTVVKTDDAEHGVFKRKRRPLQRSNV